MLAWGRQVEKRVERVPRVLCRVVCVGADWKQCGRELWDLQMTVYLVVARPEDERWECKQVGPSGLSLQRLWPTVPLEPRVRVGFARLTL